MNVSHEDVGENNVLIHRNNVYFEGNRNHLKGHEMTNDV